MSGGAPDGAGPITRAADASPNSMREVRTVPILSENFSPATTSTGRSVSSRSRTASAIAYGNPAQAATMSYDPCVWDIPSWPESQAATDGIARVLVHEQNT